jgi:hypothetical protein
MNEGKHKESASVQAQMKIFYSTARKRSRSLSSNNFMKELLSLHSILIYTEEMNMHRFPR